MACLFAESGVCRVGTRANRQKAYKSFPNLASCDDIVYYTMLG
jgi:hypothetical protein